MSRAYRIQVKESVRRTVGASDEIGTRIELLDILPPEAMADLLRRKLKAKGFDGPDDGPLKRKQGQITITVDPCSGDVTVHSEQSGELDVEVKRDGHAIDDIKGSHVAVEQRLRERAREEIEKRFQQEQESIQSAVTEALEQSLDELQPELQAIINEVTRDALKTKAAQLGTIREIHEDAEAGSLTIKIEV